MRVRFFPVGNGSRRSIVFDRQPIQLCDLVGDGSVAGRLDCTEGTIVLADSPRCDGRVRVNGTRMSCGPVMPGDRLTVGERDFVVSYERTTGTLPMFASYLLGDDGQREGVEPSVPA